MENLTIILLILAFVLILMAGVVALAYFIGNHRYKQSLHKKC